MQQTQAITSSLPCNLCGGHDVSVLATQSRNGGPLRSVICNSCGLVWSDPFPHDPRQFYEHDYRVEYKNTYAPKPKHILRAGKIALDRHAKIKHFLRDSKQVLDVGTGGGEFAYLLKSLGHDLQGIEPNKGYAEYSAAEYGLNLQIGFIQDATLPTEHFDLITIWHVLEHTEDPSLVLRNLRSWLKPDGILVVEVPSIEATCQAPKSTFHEAHLYNFNLETLRKMGEKAGLMEHSHLFSADGGNMTIFFQRANANNSALEDLRIEGNAARIQAIVHGHTNTAHFLTATPYQRFVQRMGRALSEKIALKNFDNNKALLDQLYQSCKSN
ncbi:class I SAM-dependent methyltransferase [Methylomonas sp. SURF-2]|uniref:Class I SAM-dependent methyltransferase n=1 Tax=Methylomonas subterranea TaxID=2952225 RepID=A0ABT1TFS3_9GAMM|nr:class I SAM-dependent methyltransferase [Methylomonas sp. SURF-2]MCQ8104308.1 class I SAM-dependent methyltransferase [Methylomonas sp. SURF-2]